MYIAIISLAHLHSCNSFTFLENNESGMKGVRSALLVWAEWQVSRYQEDAGIEKG